jgi:hypothetical protein
MSGTASIVRRTPAGDVVRQGGGLVIDEGPR